MSNTGLGFIIWGCKGGYRVFCSNNVVNYKEDSIAHTYKDIRAEYNFHFTQVNLTTYALEFTNQYKVYTIFRSSNDNGTGAYVAITIYVPHHLHVQALRSLLDQMMNEYFKEYVHPVFGTYNPGKYDDIEPYAQMLQSAEVTPESTYYAYQTSTLNRQLHLLLYDDIREVDAYFDSPYRKEFYACQEVMLMSREIYGKKPEAVSFIAEKSLISHVSEPELLPQLFVGDNPDVFDVAINGKEVDKSKKHPIDKEHDKIRIVLSRKYYEDIILEGTANELKQNRKLKELSKILSIFPQFFHPKKYDLFFQINGMAAKEHCLFIKKQGSFEERQKIVESTFTIRGDELSTTWEVWLAPYPSTNKGDTLFPVKTIIPKDYIEAGNQSVELEATFYKFQIVFDQGIRFSRFNVTIGKQKDKIQLPVPAKSGQTYILSLPKDMDAPELQFSVDDNTLTCQFDTAKRILTISSDVKRFSLYIPDEIKSHITAWDFLIEGKSKRVSKYSGDLELSKADNVFSGKLTINDKEYDFEVHDDKVIPKLVYIKSSSYPCGSSEKKIPFDMYPYNTEEDIDKINARLQKEHEGCDILQSDLNSPIRKLSVKPKQPPVTNKDKNTHKKESAIPQEFMLRLKGCRNFRLDKENSIPIDKDDFSIKFKSDRIPLYYKEKRRCYIYKEQKNYDARQEAKDRKKGLYITYSENECTVTYSKSKHTETNHKPQFSPLKGLKTLNLLKSKCIWISLAVLVIIILLVVIIGGVEKKVWNFSFMQDKSFKVAHIKFSFDKDCGDELAEVNFQNPYIQKDTTCVDSFSVNILWDKHAKKKADEILRSDITAKYRNNKSVTSLKLKEYKEAKKIINSLLSDKEGKKFKTIFFHFKIKSPSQKTIEELDKKIKKLTGNRSNSIIDSVFEYSLEALGEVKGNSTAEGLILEELQGIIEDLDDKDKPYAFKAFKEKFSYYESSDVYEEISSIADNQEKMESVKESAILYKKQLQSLDCTLDKVKEVKDWWKRLDNSGRETAKKETNHYNFHLYLEKFETFFTTDQMNDMNNLLKYKSCFGEEQYEVIKNGFLRDSNSFKLLIGKRKNFREAYDEYNLW